MKTKFALTAALLCALALLTACADNAADIYCDGAEPAGENTRGESKETARETMPAEMPKDFAIRFSSGIGAPNIYDTYTGTIQKDLVIDGTATATFYPSEETLREIYAKTIECDLYSIAREMTSDVLAVDGFGYGVMPLTTYKIRITAYGKTYNIRGDATAEGFVDTDKDAAHFMTFVRFMSGILYNAPEYQSLPAANGGYE